MGKAKKTDKGILTIVGIIIFLIFLNSIGMGRLILFAIIAAAIYLFLKSITGKKHTSKYRGFDYTWTKNQQDHYSRSGSSDIKSVKHRMQKIDSSSQSYSKKVRTAEIERSIDIRLPYDKTFDLCVNSIKAIDSVELDIMDREGGRIIARPDPGNKQSSIQMIKFDIDEITISLTSVEIEIKHRWEDSYVGQNEAYENGEKIINYLLEQSTGKRRGRQIDSPSSEKKIEPVIGEEDKSDDDDYAFTIE